ncbi:helix-turn-helix domain-containing protein [Allomuricauda sp. d1]|uniref:helix-turn-helix domain-containing protein n=1 Tax=Allomuricauda sp. d1 TaxID=3136725 RepID=UPI0031D62826
MRYLRFLITPLLLLFTLGNAFAISIKGEYRSSFVMATHQDSLDWADYYYNIHRYKKAIPLYEKSLENSKANEPQILKKLALSQAALENPDASVSHLYDYLALEFNPTFLLHEGFDDIRGSEKFDGLSTSIIPKINAWSIAYFVIALIGFYVTVIILVNNKINRIARYLISAFLFIHSLFILNIAIHRANYLFEYPHTYLMSTWASFLYGPLLYFYFKRITQKYVFRAIDLLHLVPTVVLTAYLIVYVYSMGHTEKVNLMITRLQNGLNPQDSSRLLLIVILKTISLATYAFFIRRIYQKAKNRLDFDVKTRAWQKNIYQIHISYVLIYSVYGILIVNQQQPIGLLYHASVAAMALMVLYVGYSANIQPHVFGGAYSYTNRLFPKYEKSGLTKSLSQELKENLEHLLANEKIYKANDLCLEDLANRLNTTRHNASQVINEHFQLSFHELVNKYRIEEAKEILMDGSKQDWNIIDVAYEVGYNNKVTFNKAFKKDTNLTPTEYQRVGKIA